MIIHPKFIFIHKPKTGGNFVEEVLLKLFSSAERPIIIHKPVVKVKNYKNKFVFGVVRNPFDWYVSWWSASRMLGDKGENRLLDISNGRDNFKNFVTYVLNCDVLQTKFLNLRECLNKDIGVATYHTKRLFYDGKNNILLDKVVKTESLRDELFNIVLDFGIPEEKAYLVYEHEKVNVSNRKINYMEYYDNDLIKLIKHKDRFIFENFNY